MRLRFFLSFISVILLACLGDWCYDNNCNNNNIISQDIDKEEDLFVCFSFLMSSSTTRLYRKPNKEGDDTNKRINHNK